VQQVDASPIDALYEHVRARGGKCRHCWQRVRRGSPPLRIGERYRPRPGADEVVHKLDCVNGWPLSASAVREVHSVLSGAFKQALAWGWIAHNPVKQATAPSAGSAGVSPPDAQGVARLLEAARDEDPELGLFLRLAVVLGARRGELCGLKWRDVDLDNGEVFIASGVVQAALAAGASLPSDAFVFSQKAGGSKPASPDGVTHRFQQRHVGRIQRDHRALQELEVIQVLGGGVTAERRDRGKDPTPSQFDAPKGQTIILTT
jgi:integrase